MIDLPSPEATLALGKALGRVLQVGDVVGLNGPLGAGKSVLARGVLRGLGFDGDVPSPTFPILIPYDPPAVRLPLTHADLYRIENRKELDELGLDEGLEAGALIVEWPDRLGACGWPDMLVLSIAVADGRPAMTARVPPPWEPRWPPP